MKWIKLGGMTVFVIKLQICAILGHFAIFVRIIGRRPLIIYWRNIFLNL